MSLLDTYRGSGNRRLRQKHYCGCVIFLRDLYLNDNGSSKEPAEYLWNQLARVPFIMLRTTKVDINGRFLGHVFYFLDDTIEKDDIYTDGRYLNQELLDKGFARLY